MGVGCQRLRLCARPDSLAQKQALAAVGQVHLMRYYDDLFTAVDLVSARCRRHLSAMAACDLELLAAVTTWAPRWPW